MILWIIITFIYLTMNMFIQRISLLSVGVWLICMCSDNIHKLEDPGDRAESEVVLNTFLNLWRCFSGNGLCLHQKLDVRLPCPDIFKGKSITFLFQWIKLIKKPSLYSGALEKKLFCGSEWKQRQRWKESFLKKKQKDLYKGVHKCRKWGERGALYLDWE